MDVFGLFFVFLVGIFLLLLINMFLLKLNLLNSLELDMDLFWLGLEVGIWMIVYCFIILMCGLVFLFMIFI